MKKFLISSALVLAASVGLTGTAPAVTGAKYDWTTDGGDNQRSGWDRQETILSKANIKGLKLKWTLQTDNAARALQSFMPPLVIGKLQTAQGEREVALLTGISDNLYAVDAETGKLIWRRSWAGADPATANVPDPNGGFLRPGGATDTPVIGPADAQGRRPIYFVTGDGVLNTVNAATGEDIAAPFFFQSGKNWALNLVGRWILMQSIYNGASHAAVNLDDPTHTVYKWNSTAGGAWGRRGLAVSADGTAYGTTGDGPVDMANGRVGNSLIATKVVDNALKLVDWYTPRNWEWLQTRDLDPNNTPTIFNFKGREILAASGKECRVTLLDIHNLGGADHQTPLAKSPLVCNDLADFQDHGSWGALSNWKDAAGVQWVIVPFWGPQSTHIKFKITNTPVTNLGGIAAFKVTGTASKPVLNPAWVSRDMNHGEPAIIANGMIFTFGSGENTRQSWPDRGLYMTSDLRATVGVSHAIIYVLDAQTGKELWNSGDTIKSWNHFSGLTVANGKVYLGTYDGMMYCFSL